MIALAHAAAALCYVGAAALAAAPFVRPVAAPVRSVIGLLAAGVVAHLVALTALAVQMGSLPLFGLGPALSSAAFLLAVSLLAVEALARDVSLALVGAPFAGIVTLLSRVAGLSAVTEPQGARGVWLLSHVALSFLGIAAFGTAAAAATIYLVQRRELRSRRFGSVFRLFPPLATLDRVNHVATVIAWLGLSVGMVLAASYAVRYQVVDLPKIIWAVAAWAGVSVVTFGRVVGGWQARRAALLTSCIFGAVLLLYVVLRAAVDSSGRFL
ncbi:MAG TPA: cytochrome c biogenesis protein CcsA [Gemmatimonadaceae bacterium]|nr:cytochrome c biogenesis protein CcsA [Gemmatimonadaceae bacterium]